MTSPLSAPPLDVHSFTLCLQRLHGRRVEAQAVRLSGSEVVLGADSPVLAAEASRHGPLHIASQHAVVRLREKQWTLEPAGSDVILTLNDAKILWGDSRVLNPGDRIDMGFASLVVETLAQFEPEPIALPQTPPSILEIADIQDATSLAEFGDLAEFWGIGESDDEDISPEPAVTPPVTPVASAEQQESSQDPLARLAAESARALTGSALLTDGYFPAVASVAALPDVRIALPVPAEQTALPTEAADCDPLPDTSSAASLEEILEGPLTIDDVLENLRRTSPARSLADSDPLAALTSPERAPDPLLLLAGMTTPTVREPELAPVLHREHRTTGIHSPYIRKNDQEEPQEDSCLPPTR